MKTHIVGLATASACYLLIATSSRAAALLDYPGIPAHSGHVTWSAPAVAGGMDAHFHHHNFHSLFHQTMPPSADEGHDVAHELSGTRAEPDYNARAVWVNETFMDFGADEFFSHGYIIEDDIHTPEYQFGGDMTLFDLDGNSFDARSDIRGAFSHWTVIDIVDFEHPPLGGEGRVKIGLNFREFAPAEGDPADITVRVVDFDPAVVSWDRGTRTLQFSRYDNAAATIKHKWHIGTRPNMPNDANANHFFTAALKGTGYVVGLDQVDDTDDVMYTNASRGDVVFNDVNAAYGVLSRDDVLGARDLYTIVLGPTPQLEANALGRTGPYRTRRISTGAVTPFPDGANVNMEKVDQVGNVAAFTLTVRAKNVGTEAINWGFPMRERADNAWVMANKNFAYPFLADNPMTVADERESPNGFSGWSEGLSHAHDVILPGIPAGVYATGDSFYGPHPHIQMFLFCQPPGNAGLDNLVLLGTSELKHTFSTATQFTTMTGPDEESTFNTGADANPHFFGPGEIDTYSNSSNQDRDFLGPMSEINKTTFVVANHDHFGTRAMVPDPADPTGMTMIPLTESGFNVWDRDHGEKEDVGNLLIHRLQANVNNLDPSLQPAGTKWFAAASYFVPGESEADRADNTIYRQFDPTDLTAIKWIGASIRGPFLAPRDQYIAAEMSHVPEPATRLLFGVAALGMLVYRGRRRVSVLSEDDVLGARDLCTIYIVPVPPAWLLAALAATVWNLLNLRVGQPCRSRRATCSC